MASKILSSAVSMQSMILAFNSWLNIADVYYKFSDFVREKDKSQLDDRTPKSPNGTFNTKSHLNGRLLRGMTLPISLMGISLAQVRCFYWRSGVPRQGSERIA